MLCGTNLHFHQMLPKSHPIFINLIKLAHKPKYVKGERKRRKSGNTISVYLTLKAQAVFCQKKKPKTNKQNQTPTLLEIKEVPTLSPGHR